MKKLLLLVLLLALGAAAFFTKPQDPKASFTNYLASGENDSLIPKEWTATWVADHCEYKDRLLWVDVKIKDKTVYTAAYGHWFNRAELKKEVQDNMEKAKGQLDKGVQKIDSGVDKLAGKS